MSPALVQSGIALFCIIAGMCFLSISIFLRQWFVKGGFLRKRYSGDDGRIFFAMIGIFFVIGGIAFMLSK
jgi:hypothetical protein